MESTVGGGWRSKHSGDPLVHGDDSFRRGFGAKDLAARVELGLVEPREAKAQGGVD